MSIPRMSNNDMIVFSPASKCSSYEGHPAACVLSSALMNALDAAINASASNGAFPTDCWHRATAKWQRAEYWGSSELDNRLARRTGIEKGNVRAKLKKLRKKLRIEIILTSAYCFPCQHQGCVYENSFNLFIISFLFYQFFKL